MEKNIILKKTVGAIVLLIIALTSIFAISPVASSAKFHAKTIKSLDDKKVTVMKITAGAAGTATVLAAIPSDATTPLANQILKLSSYLLIVIGTIFLEKILLSLTGYAAFSFLIPIACLSYGIYLFTKKDFLKNLAIKLSIFGIIIYMVVPVSVQVSNLIENTYNQTLEEAQNVETISSEDVSSQEDSENSKNEGWSGVISKFKDNVSNGVSKVLEKGKSILSNLIDAIAVLIITSCVIPILVLVFFVWIVKIIFGINIKIPNNKKVKVNEEKIKENN